MKNPRDLMLMRGVSNCLCPTQSFPCAGAMRGMSMSTNASNSSAVLWSLDSLQCFHSQCTFNDHPPFEIPSAIKRDKLHFVRRGSPLFPWGPEVVQSLWTLHAKKMICHLSEQVCRFTVSKQLLLVPNSNLSAAATKLPQFN